MLGVWVQPGICVRGVDVAGKCVRGRCRSRCGSQVDYVVQSVILQLNVAVVIPDGEHVENHCEYPDNLLVLFRLVEFVHLQVSLQTWNFF